MNAKHLPVLIGIFLPVIFIVIITIVIFAPSLSIKPEHNFLYIADKNYLEYNQQYQHTYAVRDSLIVLEPITPREDVIQTEESPTLYLYDVKKNTSHQISFAEAQNYFLDPGPSSPDGYTIVRDYGHDGIFELMGSNDSNNGYFISKDNGKKKLSGLDGRRYWHEGNFTLIGWIK